MVVLENEILYGEAFPIDEAALDKDFTVPIGKAKVGANRPAGSRQLADDCPLSWE